MDRAEADIGEAGGWRKAVAGALLILLALVIWSSRGVVSSWFATSYLATIEFTTTGEGDDARIGRAVAATRSRGPAEATFERLPGLTHIRHSAVHVPGRSRAEAIAAAQSLAPAVVAAFDLEGPGHLDARVRNRADPAPGGSNATVGVVLACGAAMLALAGVVLLCLGWRQWPEKALVGGMPRAAAFGAIGLVAIGVAPLMIPGWLVMALFAMAIPGAIAGVAVYKMQEVRRAARWPSTPGRIVRSRLHAVRQRHSDEATTVGNLPDIEYAYAVGGVDYRGHRLGIGEILPGSPQVEAALERYKVGRTGPVYYNPDDPKEAVLERDPPAPATVVYGIAAAVMLVSLAIVIAFSRASEIIARLQPWFPPGAVVQGFLFCAAAGLLLTAFLVANRRTARAAARWPTVTGRILSSVAESHVSILPGRRRSIVWSPVVEYSYRVGERDYHGSRLAFGADVAGSQAFAEATVARYPVGREVTVHHDPANPSFAVLEPQVAFAWPTLLIAVAFFAAAIFFSGWRGFLP